MTEGILEEGKLIAS